jgi:hypothetical protein
MNNPSVADNADNDDNDQESIQLASKYRESWYQISEGVRQALCKQLGLNYTSASDERLLRQVASKQQKRYIEIKKKNQQLSIDRLLRV